jgi:hypothetical protein
VDFVAVVDPAIAFLRQRRRLAYRTLQLQLQLDDTHLEALRGCPEISLATTVSLLNS